AYEISAAESNLEAIRRAIFEEIRTQGRRLTVDEARRKFGWYGVEGIEVIASMAESGLLIEEDHRRPAPAYHSTNASSDLGRSIESAIHSIVSEISATIEKESFKEGFKESAQSFKEVGREIKRQFKGGRGWNPSRTSTPSTAAFNKYRSELSAKAGKLRRGLIVDILSFLAINPLVWYININYASGFRWAPIVTILWGFGVLESILSAFRVSRQAREVEALPDLDEPRTKELKTIHKARDSIGKHFINALSIPAALFYINMTFDRSNPWFVIPTAILAVTFVLHFIGYIATGPSRSRKFFEKLGIGRSRKDLKEATLRRESTKVDLGSYTDIYRSAQESASDIEVALASSDPKDAAEMKPQLDGYLKQVLLLAKTANELDAIIGEIPMAALEKDKAALMIKLEGAKESMKSEYEGSIAEIEKQKESFKALAEQREVIDLRLRSSVSQLQQLKMELARAKAFDAESDTGRKESAILSLRTRSEELSRYIDDLKEGNLEALADPFIELEKKFGKESSESFDKNGG
ncbi:MAG: 2TM domain-containing protein, partial [Rectinemataceae bacterium]|nr:2TM domain-containing protein [Rectinemataceae bacterium]